jgi:hypothetical protein
MYLDVCYTSWIYETTESKQCETVLIQRLTWVSSLLRAGLISNAVAARGTVWDDTPST